MSEKNQRKNDGRRPNPDDKFEWKKATRTVTFWILIFLASIFIAHALKFGEQREVAIPYTEYRQLLADGKIESGYVIESVFHGTYNNVSEAGKTEAVKFYTTLPFIENWMLEEWNAKGVKYEFREKATNILGYIFTSMFPLIILIALWIFFMRRLQGGGPKGVFSFGKSRAKLLTENYPKVTFADVAGADEAKEELQEVIEFLRDPKKFQRLGGRIPRGALLLGPPGTGKTLLARAVAGEAGVPFFSMSGADFVEMFVGVGASRVRDLFEQGKKNAPCIIFIDEIDAVGRQRGAGLGGGHDEREQTLNQLLVEMDGFESNEGVILLAATNRPDVLDPALMRPGRFDRQIVVDRPDVRGREGILKVHAKKTPLAKDVDLQVLAKGTPGLAGAELANLVNEAALIAAKRNADSLTMDDFEAAKDKVMMGTERKSLLISEEEKRTTAFHEAGHVLVSKLVPGADPVHKVTIIPRGRALGLTHYLPIDEKHNYSKTYLDAILTHLLGGRAAELLVFGQLTTGAGSDIERATEIARKMVCEWGMSEKLGPLSFGKKEEEIFLGREIAKHRDYSEQTAIDIDQEVRRIVVDAADKAFKLLQENLDKLHRLAEALLEHEILDGEEIDQVLAGKKLEKPRSRNSDNADEVETKRAAREAQKEEELSPSGGEEPSPASA
ncbi:MAG: ATP-dependent zinc metalloprotease FtsH [bacterium]